MYQPAEHRCTWCGNDFENPRNSSTKRQVIWVRLWVRLSGDMFMVRGAVCGKCRSQLQEIQVSPMALQG